jgi:hypothetical protein
MLRHNEGSLNTYSLFYGNEKRYSSEMRVPSSMD